jgi:hypothetical protein
MRRAGVMAIAHSTLLVRECRVQVDLSMNRCTKCIVHEARRHAHGPQPTRRLDKRAAPKIRSLPDEFPTDAFMANGMFMAAASPKHLPAGTRAPASAPSGYLIPSLIGHRGTFDLLLFSLKRIIHENTYSYVPMLHQ